MDSWTLFYHWCYNPILFYLVCRFLCHLPLEYLSLASVACDTASRVCILYFCTASLCDTIRGPRLILYNAYVNLELGIFSNNCFLPLQWIIFNFPFSPYFKGM